MISVCILSKFQKCEAKAGPSFVEPEEEDEGEDGPELKRKRFGKNPDVDTSFLPDVERDEEENKLREKLRQVIDANPVNRVARLPRIRCLRSLDRCLITK